MDCFATLAMTCLFLLFALCKLFPELAAGIFGARFKRADHFFGKRRILGNSLAHQDPREAEVAGISRIGRA